MSQMPRDAVVRVLQKLLAGAEADARQFSRDYYDGRASGLRTALEILAMDEDDVLPPAKTDQPEITN